MVKAPLPFAIPAAVRVVVLASVAHAARGGVVGGIALGAVQPGPTLGVATLLAGLVAAGLAWVVSLRRRAMRAEARAETGLASIPANLLVMDMRGLAPLFDERRRAGVSDFVSHLRSEPAEVQRLLAGSRAEWASPTILADLGIASLARLRQEPRLLAKPPYLEAFRFVAESLWAGRQLVEDEFGYRDDADRERTCMVRARVPDDGRGGPDWSRVVLMLVDTTASKSGVASRLGSQELVQRILGQANILLWWAKVRREDGRLHWKMHVPRLAQDCPLYRLATSLDKGGLWDSEHAPDSVEMEARARRAIEEGRPGYQHEFRVHGEDGLHWLCEDVGIQQLGGGEWSLVGVVTDVTARRAADEARRVSDAMIAQILERADCMLWQGSVTRRSDGTFCWEVDVPVSNLMRRVLGRTRPLLRGGIYDPTEVFPDREEMDRLSSRALNEGWPGYEQFLRVVRDGQTHWLHEQVSIRPTGPAAWYLVGVAIDVTAQRLAEEARHASEARLSQILNQVDCLVWQANVVQRPDGALHWAMFVPPSQLYRKLFGRDPRNEGGAELWSVVQVPELAEMNARSRDAMALNLSGYEQAFRVVGPDRTYWLHEHVSIVRVGDREWRLGGVVTDITERRDAQLELAEQKERLTVTLEAMKEAVVSADGAGVVRYVNRAAAELLGLSPSKMVGRRLSELFVWENGQSGLPLDLSLQAIIAGGLPQDLPPHTVLRVGSQPAIQVEGCHAPVRSPEGGATGVVLVVRDVSERLRLESELLRTSKLESIGVLAGGIAHDFNNLLTAIMGNVSLALLDERLDPDTMHGLREAERATARARDLTGQLLTFAKGGEPVRTSLLLPDMLVEVANFALHGSSVRCAFEIPQDLWPAHADKGQIAQVVQNLVINAAQAVRSGTISIRAANETLEAAHHGGLAPGPYVWIEVADNGPGISQENLARIFDPYFTTKPRGSGLGLATVYAIVRRHGGSIEVQSELGQGARFRFWLPAKPGAPRATANPATPETRQLTGRVLVMDDEEAIRKVADKMLRRLGLDVVLSSDGAEAVELVRNARRAGNGFDCVILDLTVPGGMGGEEALRLMRAAVPNLRAIISSGYSEKGASAFVGGCRVQGTVAKPYSMDEFARVLEQVLGSEGPV